MKKLTLQEQISRIKGMIKLINEDITNTIDGIGFNVGDIVLNLEGFGEKTPGVIKKIYKDIEEAKMEGEDVTFFMDMYKDSGLNDTVYKVEFKYEGDELMLGKSLTKTDKYTEEDVINETLDIIVEKAYNNANHDNIDWDIDHGGKCVDVKMTLVGKWREHEVEFLASAGCDVDDDGYYGVEGFKIMYEFKDVTEEVNEELRERIKGELMGLVKEARDDDYSDEMKRNGLSWKDFI